MSKSITNNQREALSVVDSVAHTPFYLKGNSSDGSVNVNITSGGIGLIPESYDYIAYTNTSSTIDTYIFKTGGSGGTTVATVTITYTDTTKNQVSTVART